MSLNSYKTHKKNIKNSTKHTVTQSII